MNTNALKKFAQETRRKLIEQIAAKLQYVLNTDSPALRERATQVQKLKQAIEQTSVQQVLDKVAYTWFNRLMALRFMDANDYQPLGIRILTPKEGYTLPELLDEARQGHIPTELTEGSRPLVNVRLIHDLLDGRVPSANPQNEVYTHLLIGACNHLSQVFPFLFELIDDYTELLLPDDLTSELSVVHDVRKGMSEQDCHEVEIIGWLYQFYISEKKDEVFAAKSAVKKEDIPAATQLFTPRWIVEYMVQNTLGKLWLQNNPASRLRALMPYYIESASAKADDFLRVNSVEEITLLDQACGSGHILVYAFELFYKIYEEEGYNPSEIPALIIEKNLFGFEIDERAAQLASLALMMKARSYQRRFFRKHTKPSILCYQDFTLTEPAVADTAKILGFSTTPELLADLQMLRQATNYGSLMQARTPTGTLAKLKDLLNQNNNDVFLSYNLAQLKPAIEQLWLLSQQYHCIVDNPPYMGGGNMNKPLGDFVKLHYPDSKADLMACFMEAGLRMLHPKGFLGMINQHSWMFLSSYEKLRGKLIDNTFFDTLLHLGPRTFPEIGGEVVQNASFTFWNTTLEAKGAYVRLVDLNSTDEKRDKTIEAIQNPDCGWFYHAQQKDFEKIQSKPIAYDIPRGLLKAFEYGVLINDLGFPRKGMVTANNPRFVRTWYEVENLNIGFGIHEKVSAKNIQKKWFPYTKGGSFRRWSGNNEHIINWKNDGEELLNLKNEGYKVGSTNHNLEYIFKEAIVWTKITSDKQSFRIVNNGFLFDDASGLCPISNKLNTKYILGLLNSSVANSAFKFINPTLNLQPGNVSSIPVIFPNDDKIIYHINTLILANIGVSNIEWNSRETSWDFQQNELIRLKGQDLEESYDLYKAYWQKKFFELHRNEEELNRQFIEIYGLQDELTPDVPLEDITILKEESSIQNNELVFDAAELMAQFVSYAVGCMFGRYSLDTPGLILANQGETLSDFLTKTGKSLNELSFVPDEDNVIPVLDDEWFEDDIVGRFKEFLKVTFGKQDLDRNLAFVEECLGKDIRRYFTKDFYADHIRRYKKRPIYWMFSSGSGSFNVLIYMHRYTPDTLNKILIGYLVEYREKLNTRIETLTHLMVSGTSAEQTRASKEQDKIKKVLLELKEYEREILYPLATKRISIDLDEGVLVNYNKFGATIKEVPGLNDKATKKKVKEFDWINTKTIQ